MKKIVVLIFISIVLGGCHHFDVKHYKVDNLIGVSKQKTSMILLGDSIKSQNDGIIKKIIEGDKKAVKIINNNCTAQKPALTIAAPIIASTGQLLFDLYIEKQTKKLENLKKKAQATYSGNAILTSDEFRNCDCAILTRQDTENNLGLIAIVKLEKHGSNDAFSIVPIYIKAFNSRALTSGQVLKKDKEKFGKNAKETYLMNVSIGFAVKAISENDNGLPVVASVGGSSVSISDLKIGQDVDGYQCEGDCPPSDIIPYLIKKDVTISVSMSVTETGDVGIDFEQEQAELTAIKAALGPSIASSITKYFESKDE